MGVVWCCDVAMWCDVVYGLVSIPGPFMRGMLESMSTASITAIIDCRIELEGGCCCWCGCVEIGGPLPPPPPANRLNSLLFKQFL